MERQRHLPQSASGNQAGQPGDQPDIDQTRERLQGMADAADRLLDAYTPIQAEQFLQANRQMSAE